MAVLGQTRRVQLTITDSEEPTVANIYRSTCPDGPYQFVKTIDYPMGTSVWYDSTVDWNTNYYYYIGEFEASGNPAQPTGLSNPPAPPPPVTNFLAQDIPSDNGGQVYLTWDWTSPSYALYKDGKCMFPTTQAEYIDTNAVTGKNHEYKIRKRQYYSSQNDYLYSSAVAANCTPVNNLVPSAPTNLTGEKSSGIKMRWSEPDNFDIHGYNIYRKINAGSYTKINIVPCPRAFYYDTPVGWVDVYYKVTSVDWSGNESGYSNEIHFTNIYDPTGGIQGASTSMLQTRIVKILPNPIVGSGIIHFNLAQSGLTKIDIHDAAGRFVFTLLSDNLPAGNHTLNLDGKRLEQLPNGVYFLKMRTADYQGLDKIVIRR